MSHNMYPTKEEVRKANLVQLTTWNRFLPSPANDEEVEILELVCNEYAQKKSDDNFAAAQTSKKVGWDGN